MATLSSYPPTRHKVRQGHTPKTFTGEVQLRLTAAESRLLRDHFSARTLAQHRFILQGTLKPFHAELLVDAYGRRLANAGSGRLDLRGRKGDLSGLNPGDDVRVRHLALNVEGDRVWIVQTSKTTFDKTVIRARLHEPPSAAAPRSGRPVAAAPTPAPVARPVQPAVPAASRPNGNEQLLLYKEKINGVLAQHGIELVTVVIKDGKIDKLRIRRIETLDLVP